MNQTLTALLIFVAMYVLLLIFSERRWIIALAAAAIFILMGILPVYSAIRAINWNVLMMLAGTMMTVELFIQSKMPARMSEGLLKIVPNAQWGVVALSLFSGIISAFVDNVATVLMVAPVGLAVAKRAKINPGPSSSPSPYRAIFKARRRWWATQPPYCWEATRASASTSFSSSTESPGSPWPLKSAPC